MLVGALEVEVDLSPASAPLAARRPRATTRPTRTRRRRCPLLERCGCRTALQTGAGRHELGDRRASTTRSAPSSRRSPRRDPSCRARRAPSRTCRSKTPGSACPTGAGATAPVRAVRDHRGSGPRPTAGPTSSCRSRRAPRRAARRVDRVEGGTTAASRGTRSASCSASSAGTGGAASGPACSAGYPSRRGAATIIGFASFDAGSAAEVGDAGGVAPVASTGA